MIFVGSSEMNLKNEKLFTMTLFTEMRYFYYQKKN